MFSRKMNNLLPTINMDKNLNRENEDEKRRTKAKSYANNKRHTKSNTLNIGDSVLCKQIKTNTLTPHYDPEPYIIKKVIGTKITAERQEPNFQKNKNPKQPTLLHLRPFKTQIIAFSNSKA